MQRHLSKLWGISFLGFWIMCIPALGIPRGWINILVIVSGLAVTILSFFLARALAELSHPTPLSHDSQAH